MANVKNEAAEKIDHAVDVAIRLALLGFLIYACYQIVSPFIQLLAWGAILATAVYPLYLKLLPRMKNKEGLTATSMVIVTLLILIVPLKKIGRIALKQNSPYKNF